MARPVNALSAGSNARASTAANSRASRLSHTASPQNCRINSDRFAPSVRRRPISRARFVERPTARTAKLIHATRRTATEIPARTYRYAGRIDDVFAYFTSGEKWMEVRG